MRTIADLEKLIRKQDLDYKPKETPQVVMEDAMIGDVAPVKRSSFHVSAYGRRAIIILLGAIIAILGSLILLHADHPRPPRVEILRIGVFLPLGIILGSVLSVSVLTLLARVFTPMMLYGLSGLIIVGEIIGLLLG